MEGHLGYFGKCGCYLNTDNLARAEEEISGVGPLSRLFRRHTPVPFNRSHGRRLQTVHYQNRSCRSFLTIVSLKVSGSEDTVSTKDPSPPMTCR